STVAPLVDGDSAFVNLVADILGQLEDRRARDALEDGAGQLGGHDRAVLQDEVEVHPAELLDPPALHGVQERDLVAAVGRRLYVRGQAGGAVATTLGLPGAAGGGSGLVGGQPDGHGLEAPGEVG